MDVELDRMLGEYCDEDDEWDGEPEVKKMRDHTGLKDRISGFIADPTKKKMMVGILAAVGTVFLLVFIVLGNNLRSFSMQMGGMNAVDLIAGNAPTAERNAAGGLIADIDWENTIGYDRDGNPIVGTHSMVPAVGGYDMCGAPIGAETLTVTGVAEDGRPIYDGYVAIDQARLRGISSTDGNADINWSGIVGYDEDCNPLFGSYRADQSVIGYDLAGNAIPVGSVTVAGRTDSGMPIYHYSAILTIRTDGQQNQKLKNGG